MSILLLGLNHRTAPVEVREQLSRSTAAGDLHATLADLIAADHPTGAALREAVVLSTCNRFEVYVDATDVAATSTLLQALLADQHPVTPHLYCHTGRDAVHHLMRVAAGLDSLVLGETQILGQVALAGATAQPVRSVGPLLTHLFGRAVHAGRRVRHETSICGQTTSISHAAALLIQQRLGDRPSATARVLIVGAGEMATLGGQALHQRGFRELVCVNRTAERAAALAQRVEGRLDLLEGARAGDRLG